MIAKNNIALRSEIRVFLHSLSEVIGDEKKLEILPTAKICLIN